MCGIAGFIAGHGAANAAALAPMLARIAHRGPDGQGTFVEGPAALGHCRLAIIDLEGGAQPLYSEDKNLVVVFNGEIYNYRALTAELTALGHTFATRTDTEVLLHGWEQWGRELLPRLRGMFAFALWDRRAERREHPGAVPAPRQDPLWPQAGGAVCHAGKRVAYRQRCPLPRPGRL